MWLGWQYITRTFRSLFWDCKGPTTFVRIMELIHSECNIEGPASLLVRPSGGCQGPTSHTFALFELRCYTTRTKSVHCSQEGTISLWGYPKLSRSNFQHIIRPSCPAYGFSSTQRLSPTDTTLHSISQSFMFHVSHSMYP